MGRVGLVYVHAGAALLAAFLYELRVLASLLLCVCALDSPFRSRVQIRALGNRCSCWLTYSCSSIFRASALPPLLCGGRRARREARRKSERVDFNR